MADILEIADNDGVDPAAVLFYAVLHLGGKRSPLNAVRAAIVAERRGGHHG